LIEVILKQILYLAKNIKRCDLTCNRVVQRWSKKCYC